MRWSLFACRECWGVDGEGMAIVVVVGDGGKVAVAVAGGVGRGRDGAKNRESRRWFCYKSRDPTRLLGA